MPWRSAHAPNSASAPGAPPLNRMQSAGFMRGSVHRAGAGPARVAAAAACARRGTAGSDLRRVGADGKHRQLFFDLTAVARRAFHHGLFADEQLELTVAAVAFVFVERHNHRIYGL